MAAGVRDAFLEEVLPESEEECVDSQKDALPSWFSVLIWMRTVVSRAWWGPCSGDGSPPLLMHVLGDSRHE